MACNDPTSCGNASASYGGYDCLYDLGLGCGIPNPSTTCLGQTIYWDQQFTITTSNGNVCYAGSVDAFGQCCGNCNDLSACDEDLATGNCIYLDCNNSCSATAPSTFGCTDPTACNYDEYAGCDDGSCTSASNDYFGNYCCDTSIGTDHFGNSLCDGFAGSCSDISRACGEDTAGCLYADCTGYCNGEASFDHYGICDGNAGIDDNGTWYSYPCDTNTLLNGLLAYWKLDDDGSGNLSLTDSTGNGNTLTNNNGVTVGTGIVGGDAVFNGSNYLQTSNVISAATPISISAWVKTDSSGAWGGIGNIDGGYNNGFRLLGINGDIYFQAPSTNTANSVSGIYNDGNWHFFVGIADGASIAIYADGFLISTISDSSSAFGNNFFIGNGGDFITPSAQIDEVGVWGRALSFTEIQELYNHQLNRHVSYPFTSIECGVFDGINTCATSSTDICGICYGSGPDALGICGGDAILGCDGSYYSPINELGLDIPLRDGLFGQMYYSGGDGFASFSDGPWAEYPQFFNQHPEYKTQTYIATEIRNFYVDSEYVIQNLNPADFTQFGGGDSLQQYSWQFIGRFRAPYTDDFSFSTWSDDASYLWLGDNAITGYTTANAIVQNGGSHGNNIASSDPVSLNSGDYYPIRIQYGQGGGAAVLSVAYSSNTETNITNWSGIAYSVPQCSPDFVINGECCPSASGSLGSGLVAYWNFDNNLVDHTLNGYNLSGYNGSYYGSGIINSGISFPYVSGVSYLFNGSGSFVNNINIGGNQTWSISCCFKADYIYPNAPQAIWGLGGGGYGDTTLYINGTNGISLYSYGQGGSTEIIPNTGEWYYSVLNASPTGMNLYINNSLAISIPSPSENSFSGLSLSDFLGECPSGECAMVGTVDEMGYWNRELTLNEICNLYYSGSGNAFPFRQQPLCYDIIPPSSGMFIPNFIAPGLPISTAFNGKFSLSQLAGLPPTIQF